MSENHVKFGYSVGVRLRIRAAEKASFAGSSRDVGNVVHVFGTERASFAGSSRDGGNVLHVFGTERASFAGASRDGSRLCGGRVYVLKTLTCSV